MPRRFDGRIVIVTGASSGIGEAAARAFGREGAKLVLAARSPEPLTRTLETLRAAGVQAIAVPTDVGKIEALRGLVERTVSEFGGIDIVVNNAGVNHRGPLDGIEPEHLADIVAVNLTAPIVLSRLALPYLRRSPAGAIVNVASLAGRIPVTHEATYSATKFGLRAFTMALAEELRDTSVHACVVSPGPVDTNFIMSNIDEVPDLVFSQPMSTAEEIAALVLDSAADGVVERTRPRMGARLATLGYLFPALRRRLVPLLERKGRRAKARFVQRGR